ncbi:MAG: hypothetical protein ACLPUG_13215 [Acidimicrobiales bacterium]
MIWLVVVLILVGLPLAALLFGAESRDGRDWQPLRGLPNSSLDTDWPSPHMVGAGGPGGPVTRQGRAEQS